MTDPSPSLELSEVSARFSEAEGMLQDARERLHAILQHEQRKEAAADSLSQSARAVADFTERADRVLQEAGSAVSAAREILETGRHLISGNAISKVDQRVSSTLEEVQRLQAAEAKTLAAVNADATARERDQQDNKEAIAVLQARASDIDKRLASALEEVQNLQSLQADTLAAIDAEAQARADAQKTNEPLLAELQARAADIARGVTSNSKAVWFALGALLVGQIVVALLVVLT